MRFELLLIIMGAAIAAWKDILDPKKSNHKTRISLAVLTFLVFMVLAIVNIREDDTAQAEQKATYVLYQEQAAALHRLGFEFVLRDVQDTMDITSIIHMRTWVYLESFPRPGNLEQLIFFHFSGNTVLDSITPVRSVGKHNTEILQEKNSKLIRVWFYLYGLDLEGEMYWKPKTVAELQQLNIELRVTQDIPSSSEWFTGRSDLCPVEEVRIYGNKFNAENLLVRTKLVANWNRPGLTNFFGYYPVDAELGSDSSDYLFQIKQEWQYNSILDAMKSE